MLSKDKLDNLYAEIGKYKNAVVSLSGGTDSIAVAAAAKEVLGAENVVTATAITAFLTETEKNMAKAASKRLGLEHRMKRVFLMKSPDVLRNDENRCYYCKNIILTGIDEVKEGLGFEVVFDGGNATDLNERRPGTKAVEEHGDVSPLKLACFTKEDIYELMSMYGLDDMISPSNSCLATRIKTGQEIDLYNLRMICAAETYMTNMGYSKVRCRVDSNRALIQVEKSEVPELIKDSEEIISELKLMGFDDVKIDERGYKNSGEIND